MKRMGNLKIQYGDIVDFFLFAMYSINRRKSNTDENIINIAILAATEEKNGRY